MRPAAPGRSRASSVGSASSPVLHSVSAEADKTVSEIMMSASSEMLSLLDSRNVDVRIRSIVARAEQEAASKLQAAHPDDDEDGVPARRRKGGSDRASRRRELNRVNAKKSRLRKKFFIEALILRVARLEKEAERKEEAPTPIRPVLPPPTRGGAQQPLGRSTHSSDSTAATLVSVSVPAADPSVNPFCMTAGRSEQGDCGQSSTGGSSPSDAAAAAIASAGSPGAGLTSCRAVPASALTPRLRDALVVSGPDWPLVQLLESTSQAFCIADPCSPDMPLAYVSPGFEALTGYASSEAIGRNCRFLQGPGTDRAATRRMGEALKQGRGCSEVVLNYRRDGAPFWNRVLLAPLRDSTGAVRSFVSVQACVSRSLASIEQGGPTQPAGAGPSKPGAPRGEATWVPSISGPMRPPTVSPPGHFQSAAAAALERFRQAAEDAAAASSVPGAHTTGLMRPAAQSYHGPAVVRPPALEPEAPFRSPAAPAEYAAAQPAVSSSSSATTTSSTVESASREAAGPTSAPPARAAVRGHTLSDADAALVIAQISHSTEPAPPSRKRARSAEAEDGQA